MKKLEPCFKDLSLWVVAAETSDLRGLLTVARQSVNGFYLNEMLELVQSEQAASAGDRPSIVIDVKLVDEYYHEKSGRLSHCYRFFLDGALTNLQAKRLEKSIRTAFETSPSLDGIIGMR
jgi:phenylalanyl-tRNA synthetase beta subunit